MGYSFRDESIRKIIFEQMESNPNLWLYLIDPHADERRNDILRLHPEFSDRILVLTMKAEDALKGRILVENQNTLEIARFQEETARKNLLRSSTLAPNDWEGCIHNYKKLKHLDRIRPMIKEIMNFEHKQSGGSTPIEWCVLDLSIRFGIGHAWKGQREEARFWFKMLRDCWACAEYWTTRPETQLVPVGELPDWCGNYASQLIISDDIYSDLTIEIENALQMLPENDMFALTLRQMRENITELWRRQKRGKPSDYLSFVRGNHASLFKLSNNLLDFLDSQRSFAPWHRKRGVQPSRRKVPKSNS